MPKGKGKCQKRKGEGKGKINELAQWAYGQLLGQIQYGDWGLGPYAGPISAVNLVGHAENVTTRKCISSTKESDGFTKVSKGSRPQAPKATTLGDIFLSQDIFSKLREADEAADEANAEDSEFTEPASPSTAISPPRVPSARARSQKRKKAQKVNSKKRTQDVEQASTSSSWTSTPSPRSPPVTLSAPGTPHPDHHHPGYKPC